MNPTLILPAQSRGITTSLGASPDYLSHFLAVQTSPKTRTVYQSELKLFAEWVRKGVQEITPFDVIEYRRELETRGLKSSTVFKKLSVLRSFFTFYSQLTQQPNPALVVKLPKITDESTKAILTLQEAVRLLSAPDHSTSLGKRDRAILGLLLINGWRTIEVSRANVGDLHDVEGFHVLRVHGKGGKEADSKLRDDLWSAIQDYLGTRGEVQPEDPLFLSIGNLAKGRISAQAVQVRVRHYLKRTGIQKANLSAHSLRHTCATLTLSIGKADITQIQTLLRHSDPRTSMRYLKNLNWLERNAVDLNPISFL